MAAGWGLDIRSVFKSYQKEWLSSFGQMSWCHCQWLQITSLIFVYSWPFVSLSFLLLPSLNLTAAYDSCNCFLNLTPSLFLNILLGSGSFTCLTWTSDVIPSSKKVNKDFSTTYLFSGSWHGVQDKETLLEQSELQKESYTWGHPAQVCLLRRSSCVRCASSLERHFTFGWRTRNKQQAENMSMWVM